MTGKKQFYSKKLRGKVQEFLNLHNLPERRAKRVKLGFNYFYNFLEELVNRTTAQIMPSYRLQKYIVAISKLRLIKILHIVKYSSSTHL